MDVLARYAPPAAGRRAKRLAGPRLTVVFFDVGEDITSGCRSRLRPYPLARAEATNLQVARAAASTFQPALLVVSATMPAPDREALVAEMRQSTVPVLWVCPDHPAEDTLASITSWAASFYPGR